MSEQFADIAGKLLDRINSITFQQKKQKINQTTFSTLSKTQTKKATYGRTLNVNMASPQTQTLLQLTKIEQDLSQNQEQNIRKLKNVNEEVRKLENYIKQETQTRLKLHENFIHSVIKAEKNMQNTIANIRKIHSERQKKLEQKIEQVLKQEKKQILQQLESNISLQESVQRIKSTINNIKQEIVYMKRTRIQLEDKITGQFNEQIKDLKTVFSNSVKMREERQLKILQMLKNIYKKNMESIKKEQIERQASQKMFLTVIEQLIDRITEA